MLKRNCFFLDTCKKYAYNLNGDNMETKNKLYQNQGAHLISAIFTVINGKVKVLLVRRKNEPYYNKWILVSGALYNNEELEVGVRREIFEKSGIKDIKLYQFHTYGDLNRSRMLDNMRMLAICYIGVIDAYKVNILSETIKTSAAEWFDINNVPIDLGYDHNIILQYAINELKTRIDNSNILKSLFPETFTLPELQKVYETIQNIKIDRRNFRKRLLNLNIIEDTNKTRKFEGNKPAKLYRFK